MPVLTVKGMPQNVDLGGLLSSIKWAASRPLLLDPSEVSVFFPADLVQEGLGEELICMVDGLFEKPERTMEIRNLLAGSINRVLVNFALERLPQCLKVEVIISRFDQTANGFAVWERGK